MSDPIVLRTLGSVIVLALVHVLAHALRPDRIIPRRYWLSFADGVSLSYVFLELLPKVFEGSQQLGAAPGWVPDLLERNPLLLLLLGVVFFYGLLTLVERPLPQRVASTRAARVWIHIACLSVYKGVLGYLLVQQTGVASILMYTAAIAMHFLVVDYRLIQTHSWVFLRIGRWILSAAIPVGWAIGLTTVVPPPVVSMLVAFVAGGIVLMVLQEEFSQKRLSSYPAFLAGVAVYSALLLALGP